MRHRRTLLSEYAVYRSGADMVDSWRVMNRGAEDVSGFQWRLSAARDEPTSETGLYRYHCNEATNLPSTHFRFVLLSGCESGL